MSNQFRAGKLRSDQFRGGGNNNNNNIFEEHQGFPLHHPHSSQSEDEDDDDDQEEKPHHPHGTKHRHVEFTSLEIRFYERVMGDNPSCSSGPSVSIGWNFDPDITVNCSVRRYEEYRGYRELHRQHNFSYGDMILGRTEREEILSDLGYSRSQVAEAVRTNNRCKSQRRQTVNNLPAMRMEEYVERTKRQLRRLLCHQRGHTRDLYQSWKSDQEHYKKGGKNGHLIGTIKTGPKGVLKKSV